jgi:predicted ATP-dependent endonuclease of OLD family
MRLKTLFIRFYRSFNFDYLKKHSDFKNLGNRNPWEVLGLEGEEKWYPYVQIPIDAKVTTVVGANESGKSHLLDAIEKGITGNEIERKDFCRYSEFFAVQEGKMRYPDFGYEWVVSQNNHNDRKCIKQIKQIFGIPEEKDFVCFLIFRVNKDEITIYIPEENNQYDTYTVKPEHSLALSECLPQPFRIDSKIAIPDSVPIIRLIQIGMKSKALNSKIDPQINTMFAKLEREDRIQLTEELDKYFIAQQESSSKKQSTSQNKSQQRDNNDTAQEILKRIFYDYLSQNEETISIPRQKEFQLAYDLICKISKISLDALIELAKEMLSSKEGHTRAIIEQINKGLAENLNFPSWWVQDRDFQLVVSVRDYDLSFAIRDRTGTEYSFSERSSGLTYFLSYYIQYKAYEPNPKVSQILLMDEPDQYLSSQAQQNLLKIFKSFSEPNDGKKPVQVIYVTHSPGAYQLC